MAAFTTSYPAGSGYISGIPASLVGGAWLTENWVNGLAAALAAEEEYLTEDYQRVNPGDDVVVQYREGDFDYMASPEVVEAEYGLAGIPTGSLRKHAVRQKDASAKRISDEWNKVNPFA